MLNNLTEHAVPIISALIAINITFAGIIWRSIIGKLDRHDMLLERYQMRHDECQKRLPVEYARVEDMRLISVKLDKINDVLASHAMLYRTKEEAAREWRALEQRLAKIETDLHNLDNAARERHRELWDKINRLVDFMREREAAIREEIKR